jgi:inhibitor of KinA sporulation pathway (predicted exonuclease)
LAYIQEKRVEDTQKRLVEIEAYFADKNPDIKTKTTRQYLLGADIKGWFKGDQKQLQREYKNLYNSPAYQEWLNN